MIVIIIIIIIIGIMYSVQLRNLYVRSTHFR